MIKETSIEIATILSNRTKEGMVEFYIQNKNEDGFPHEGIKTQWNLSKAREIHKMLGEAIEAAVTDTLIYKFFTTKVGFDEIQASRVLLDFRELRQGTRNTSYPS
jgi:hypothetical protein